MNNTYYIEQELNWLSQLIELRLSNYFQQTEPAMSIQDVPPPALQQDGSFYHRFISNYHLNNAERICLALSLAPVLKPNLLDLFLVKNAAYDQRFSEIGGYKGTHHTGFLPTIETLLFILCGESLANRMDYYFLFTQNSVLVREKWLQLDTAPSMEPLQSSILTPAPELIELVINGHDYTPGFSAQFPAQKITTKQTWDDLVLDQDVFKQIDEINTWLQHGHDLYADAELGSRMKPGHRCLFYGPSGTGKTLTATLIGKQTGLDVLRVDLSLVVSKYIGETEKNLSRIFDRAENKKWILFFDEADALFGKRTMVKDAHDRFANQEVSYLLQRIEDYAGLVILATNFKSNIDDAFARRFQTVIHFPVPKATQRETLWRQSFSSQMLLDEKINLGEIATTYELTGGAIINVVRYCSLMALKRASKDILLMDLMEGIKREYQKESKAM